MRELRSIQTMRWTYDGEDDGSGVVLDVPQVYGVGDGEEDGQEEGELEDEGGEHPHDSEGGDGEDETCSGDDGEEVRGRTVEGEARSSSLAQPSPRGRCSQRSQGDDADGHVRPELSQEEESEDEVVPPG